MIKGKSYGVGSESGGLRFFDAAVTHTAVHARIDERKDLCCLRDGHIQRLSGHISSSADLLV
jgi:hypothetical protein